MKKSWLVSALVALSFAIAPGEPKHEIEIILHTQPEGAKILDQFGHELGTSGKPFFIDGDKYGGQITFTFQLPGHKTRSQSIDALQLGRFLKQDDNSEKVQEIYTLEPKNLWVAFSDQALAHPILVGLAGLGALLGLYTLRLRLQSRKLIQERERKVEQILSGAGAKDSLLGGVLGGWVLVDILGRGGMATVYRALPAESLDESEAVAVKVMGRQELLEGRDWERFRREIQISKTLTHPGIVQLIDYGNHESLLYLVMELVRGGTLRELLNSPQRPRLDQAWGVLSQIFAAVAFAHERQVVHRDLKPENIMVDEKGQIRVMDFGLAKSMNSEKLTATGSILGTPLYIAPEQIQGEGLDPRTDQYSLGVLCYELLSGQLPFREDDPLKLIMQHLQHTPEPPSHFCPELAGVDAVILRMLDKDMARRYPSVTEAALDLRRGLGL